jgi:nucleoside-diphosphate-sugar epimerase
VKRIILTSSCGAIYHESDKPQVFTEADWNDQAWRVVAEKGREAPGIYKYWASKTLAEQGTYLVEL